jgi:hypothetical protein
MIARHMQVELLSWPDLQTTAGSAEQICVHAERAGKPGMVSRVRGIIFMTILQAGCRMDCQGAIIGVVTLTRSAL